MNAALVCRPPIPGEFVLTGRLNWSEEIQHCSMIKGVGTTVVMKNIQPHLCLRLSSLGIRRCTTKFSSDMFFRVTTVRDYCQTLLQYGEGTTVQNCSSLARRTRHSQRCIPSTWSTTRSGGPPRRIICRNLISIAE